MGSIKAVINQSSLASYLEWIERKKRGMKKEPFITGQSKPLPVGKLGHICRCGYEWTWHPCVILMKASPIQRFSCMCQTTLSQCRVWFKFALFKTGQIERTGLH